MFLMSLFYHFVSAQGQEEEGTSLNDSSDTIEEQEPLLGLTDYVLLVIVLLVGYWYFFKDDSRSSSSNSTSFKYEMTAESPSSGNDEARSFLTKMKNKKRRMVVFYGSQTGTAEEFAARLANEGIRYGLKGVVADPEETDMEDLTKLGEVSDVLDGSPTLAVFCLATYGEGDPTDNAQEFFEWLQTGSCDLSTMMFAVFGLGNKTYEHFNAMGIYVDKRLEELGAKRVHKLGQGDDDDNLENDFVTWKDEFWASVCQEFGIEASDMEFSLRQYSAEVLESPDLKRIYCGEPARLRSFETQRPPFDQKNPYLSEIKVNRNIHAPTSDRVCLHIELDIEESRIRYEAGDHVAIYPTNDSKLVEAIGKALEIDLDVVFTMTPLEDDAIKKQPFPCPTTYRTALSHYVDICSFPRTHVLKEISSYANDPIEKEKLVKLSSREGKDLYQEYILDSTRNIVHILEDFPSLKIDIHHLMELLPRLQPRFYSISSSPRISPDKIHVTAVVVWYQTRTGRINNGVCTTWLKPMVPKEGNIYRVPIFVRRSQFRLPNRHTVPVIMIGPGTGLAPFRGFIQERSWHKSKGKPVGETHLYFGCRNEENDYIYREELEEHVSNGGLSKLYTAFSRDTPGKKVYVTHLMKENAAEIWRLIGEENGHIYVCGDAKNMAKDVHNIILNDVFKKHGNMSDEEADAYLKQMESKKRYSTDVWS